MMAERQNNEKLQAIGCDNADEYKALATTLEQENGVIVEFTTFYTPEQNGLAERLNRTLITKVRAMLVEAVLPSPVYAYLFTARNNKYEMEGFMEFPS